MISFGSSSGNWQSGAFYGRTYAGGTGAWGSGGGRIRYPEFDAEKSSPVYSGEDDKVVPDSIETCIFIKY